MVNLRARRLTGSKPASTVTRWGPPAFKYSNSEHSPAHLWEWVLGLSRDIESRAPSAVLFLLPTLIRRGRDGPSDRRTTRSPVFSMPCGRAVNIRF